MKIEFNGIVTSIYPTRVYGEKQIKEREFRCAELVDGRLQRYANILPFVVRFDPTGDKFDNTGALDLFGVGDEVRFTFTLRGRECTSPRDGKCRCFIDNKVCSRIEVVSTGNALPAKAG